MADRFTPGPWVATAYGDIHAVGEPWLLASTGGKSGLYRDWQANARLIAAAPTMLEALEKMVAEYIAGYGDAQAFARMARAAIAMATGAAQ
jgi:hypothetical protein